MFPLHSCLRRCLCLVFPQELGQPAAAADAMRQVLQVDSEHEMAKEELESLEAQLFYAQPQLPVPAAPEPVAAEPQPADPAPSKPLPDFEDDDDLHGDPEAVAGGAAGMLSLPEFEDLPDTVQPQLVAGGGGGGIGKPLPEFDADVPDDEPKEEPWVVPGSGAGLTTIGCGPGLENEAETGPPSMLPSPRVEQTGDASQCVGAHPHT